MQSGQPAYTDVYDRHGNRWKQLYNGACTAGSTFCATFDGNNHNNNGLLVYDAAGNVTMDNMHHYGYDGENRLVSVDSGATAAYVYDAEGKRVRKTTGGLSVDYVYDLAGQAMAEMNATGGWNRGEVYAGGRHVATYASSTTYFDLGDWVGTERVRTTAAGVKCETVTSLAFGDGQAVTGSCGDPSPLHFTGKQRDTESGLDDFGARYNASSLGRFMSVDPIWIKADRLADPQRLNLYAYGRNNPLKFTDPTGMDVTIGKCSGGDAQKCFNLLQQGLKKDDRSHVHLVAGDGKNGFQKGVFGVTVDKDYKSDSKNFQTLQQAANDHSATAVIDVLSKGDSTTIRTTVSWNAKTGPALGNMPLTMNGENDPFGGYTFFQFRGKIEDGIDYTPGDYSEVVVNSTGAADSVIIGSMHHELRHLVLGDFGRSAPNAKHSPTFNSDGIPKNNADRQTLDAQQEAESNASH